MTFADPTERCKQARQIRVEQDQPGRAQGLAKGLLTVNRKIRRILECFRRQRRRVRSTLAAAIRMIRKRFRIATQPGFDF